MFLESLRTELEDNLNKIQTYSLATTYAHSLLNFVLQLSINERLLLVEAISQSIRNDSRLKASRT
ncbi:hypothetical protein [Calothrix sp. CCY 0018]|uniref:hypothetical protein n=1 Tax=Calothrix sp. CCY 0018 TaxID=3103864 RepID=UPI0039C60431